MLLSWWSRCVGCVESTEPCFLSTSVRVCNSQDKASSLRDDALLCLGQLHLFLHCELSYSCWHWLQLVGEAFIFFVCDRILLNSPVVGNFKQPNLKMERKILCCLAFSSTSSIHPSALSCHRVLGCVAQVGLPLQCPRA